LAVSFMGLYNPDRRVSNLLILLAATLALGLLVSSFFDQRQSLVDERAAKLRALDDAHAMLRRQVQLKQFMAGPGALLSDDASTTQQRILHRLRDWEAQTGVTGSAFERVAMTQDHGFTRLTFQISATGRIGAVAGLLYRVESSLVPLRLDSAELRPKGSVGDDLELHMNVSALCRGRAVPATVAEGQP
jgi:hypothetical protein